MNCDEINAKNYLSRFDEIVYYMSNEMLACRLVDSITIYFIECVIPHHRAAIYMCENLLKYTNYTPLVKIAKNIIRVQMLGIKKMQEIKEATTYFYNSDQDVNDYISKYMAITKTMIFDMKNAPRCININLNFVNEMIPHHEGAIYMCENLLKYNIDSRLEEVAKSIIKEQSRGVDSLRNIKLNLVKCV